MNIVKTRMAQRGQGGFTLIELLVVIAILAILAGVVVFAVGNSTKNAGVAACKTERASIITAFNAAKTANYSKVSGAADESYTSYLSSSADIKYFTLPTAPATGAARTAATTTDVAATGVGCDNITTGELNY